ncbi:hypothetical protein GCM10027174_17900 [Salinifilum aidingensis]
MRGLLVLLTVLGLLSACARGPQPDSMVTDPVDPGFVRSGPGEAGDTDALAATVAAEAQRYWSQRFGEVHGGPWRDLRGFRAVTTTGSGQQLPPCAGDLGQVEGNAYYCADADTVVWDRSALLPVLRERYGEAAVAVVLAHEVGHAVQRRAGLDLDGADLPRSSLETMADCQAGAFLRWVHDGGSSRLRLTDEQLDAAPRALLVFRDSTGAQPAEENLHGDSFTRVAALRTGYRQGPDACGGPQPRDLGSGERPPRPLREVLRASRLAEFFGEVTGGRYRAAPPRPLSADRSDCVAPGPSGYCTEAPHVVMRRPMLERLHYDIGDQAVETVLAARYARGALRAAEPGAKSGPEADAPGPASPTRPEMCLTGAYTAGLAERGELTRSDADEAVEAVLDAEVFGRAQQGGGLTASARFDAFRAGVRGGESACR